MPVPFRQDVPPPVGGEAPGRPAGTLTLRGRTLPLGSRTLVMGILNVTPDSFYDGGRHCDRDAAIERSARLVDEGADIIDVGGESSRPGSAPVPEEEEWRRVEPLIEVLATGPAIISIDTTKAGVARRALEAGAHMVNDISGGTFDPAILGIAARHGAGLVLSHIRGTPRTMQQNVSYHDLMGEIGGFLEHQARLAREAGVAAGSIVLDPGIGFGKSAEQNVEILRRLALLRDLSYPVLVGLSRKSFIGHLTGLPPAERLEGSLGAAAAAALLGADIVRVHDVRETVRALAVVDAIGRYNRRGPAWKP